jgi:hypothetical protein
VRAVGIAGDPHCLQTRSWSLASMPEEGEKSG